MSSFCTSFRTDRLLFKSCNVFVNSNPAVLVYFKGGGAGADVPFFKNKPETRPIKELQHWNWRTIWYCEEPPKTDFILAELDTVWYKLFLKRKIISKYEPESYINPKWLR